MTLTLNFDILTFSWPVLSDVAKQDILTLSLNFIVKYWTLNKQSLSFIHCFALFLDDYGL